MFCLKNVSLLMAAALLVRCGEEAPPAATIRDAYFGSSWTSDCVPSGETLDGRADALGPGRFFIETHRGAHGTFEENSAKRTKSKGTMNVQVSRTYFLDSLCRQPTLELEILFRTDRFGKTHVESSYEQASDGSLKLTLFAEMAEVTPYSPKACEFLVDNFPWKRSPGIEPCVQGKAYSLLWDPFQPTAMAEGGAEKAPLPILYQVKFVDPSKNVAERGPIEMSSTFNFFQSLVDVRGNANREMTGLFYGLKAK